LYKININGLDTGIPLSGFFMSTALKHRTLSSAIADRLRQSILDGTHASGVQLRQDALAAMFGVSRIPVREALFQLEAEGLVQIVPHKGAIVTGLSIEEINDVFDLRALLEPRLLAASCPRLAPDDFRSLDNIQAAFEAAVAARDIEQWGVLNADFHMALYVRSGLPRSEGIVAGLLQTSDRYTRVQLSTPEAMARAGREHRDMIELCRTGNVAAACALLARHVQSVRMDLVRILKDPPTEAA
jgi:DNA-binding GntR family transcriptional regulator